jgi:hypothetical protein
MRTLKYEHHVPVNKKGADRHYAKRIACKVGSLKESSR